MGQRLSERELLKWLEENGMGRIFEKYKIGGAKKKKFLEELKKVDLERVKLHRKLLLSEKEVYSENIAPPPPPFKRGYEREGWESLRKGEWAQVILAGGAGTRFFSQMKQPPPFPRKTKGLFPITPLGNHSFLELFIAETLEVSIRAGKIVPILIMTSTITYDEIKGWLKNAHLWGFPKQFIIVFKQKEHPRLDEEGMFVVNEDGSLMWTGDGHGGLYRALFEVKHEGVTLIEWLKRKGVKHIAVHNVDNPLARPLYPARLGLHVKKNFLFTISVVKAKKGEKVGLVVKEGSRLKVVEYGTDIPELSNVSNLGHINVNLISLQAVRKEVRSVVYKNKPVKLGGKTINTSTMEMLIQNLVEVLPPEKVGMILLPREEFFSPTKSVEGVDSVKDTQKRLLNYWKSLLISAGSEVHGKVEIHPSAGLDVKSLREKGIGNRWKIGKRAELYISGKYSLNRRMYPPSLSLEKGSAFKIKVLNPYGKLKLRGRDVSDDEMTAGKIYIGKNLKIRGRIEIEVR